MAGYNGRTGSRQRRPTAPVFALRLPYAQISVSAFMNAWLLENHIHVPVEPQGVFVRLRAVSHYVRIGTFVPIEELVVESMNLRLVFSRKGTMVVIGAGFSESEMIRNPESTVYRMRPLSGCHIPFRAEPCPVWRVVENNHRHRCADREDLVLVGRKMRDGYLPGPEGIGHRPQPIRFEMLDILTIVV